jgi:putative DNA primase/helicase
MITLLDTAARALGGDIRSGQVVCPGPRHSPRDRSLAVRFHAGGGYVVHSFAGDDPIDCRDHVDRLLGLPGWKSGEGHSPRPQARPSSSAGMDRLRKIELARSIYDHAVPIPGTLVDLYLAGRCLSVVDVLRFDPQCLFGDHRMPAMVAPMVDILSHRFRGIHRTPLTTDAKKAGNAMMLGSSAGAVGQTQRRRGSRHSVGDRRRHRDYPVVADAPRMFRDSRMGLSERRRCGDIPGAARDRGVVDRGGQRSIERG